MFEIPNLKFYNFKEIVGNLDPSYTSIVLLFCKFIIEFVELTCKSHKFNDGFAHLLYGANLPLKL